MHVHICFYYSMSTREVDARRRACPVSAGALESVLTSSIRKHSNWGSLNSRTIAYVRFKYPLESSTLPGAGAVFPD